MTTNSTPPRTEPRRPWDRVVLPAIGAMVGWYVLVLLAFGLFAFLQSSEMPDDFCSGFGCSSPREETLLLGMFFGVPMLAFSALVSVITLSIALARGVRSGLAAGTVAALAGLVTSCCGVVALGGAI